MGKLTAQDAATHTFDFPSAHYRLFYELERHKLVRRHTGRPRSWSALPTDVGMQSSLRDAQAQLESLLKSGTGKERPTGHIEILIGRQPLYEAYARHADFATKDIEIYSIGIALSDKLEAMQKALTKRGVSVRHIVQRYQPSNYHVIEKWRRLGIKPRYLPTKQGFHFFVIDDSWLCITFTDAVDTENRLSILTDNPTAIHIFHGQFSHLWTEAKRIDQTT
jgi:hypothetical protein